ncbi:MAG: hypothetical protein V1688_04235 [bacterium]
MKPKTLYRDILKNSFNVTFKNKILWFFGLFAAPLMGMVEYKIVANGLGGINNNGVFSEWYQTIYTMILQLGDTGRLLITNNPAAFFIMLVIILAIILFIFFWIWIAVVAQCALIDGINQTNSKALNKTELNASINSGTKNFFPVLGIHFLVKVILTLSFLILSLPIIFVLTGNTNSLPWVLYFIFYLIFIPIIIIVIFSSKYAINYIIIEKKNFFDGIKMGYRLFADNWLISIEMSLILFFTSIFAGLFAAAVGSFTILPLALLVYILIQIKLIFLVKLILIFGLLLLIGLSLLFAAIFSTFQYSGWVLLFNKIKNGGGKDEGKLARWFGSRH